MTSLNRRQALALLLSAPLAAPAAIARAQTRATAKHRVVFNASHGLLVEPDGSVQIWQRGGATGSMPFLVSVRKDRFRPTRSRKCRG